MTITDRGKGRFGWTDSRGSDVHWQTIFRGRGIRVWLAEGQVRVSPLLPLVSVRCVVVLRHGEGKDVVGRVVVRHQAELFLHSDSATASLITRLLGASAPRVAEEYMGQLQKFYSALCRYCEQHPEEVEGVLQDDGSRADR